MEAAAANGSGYNYSGFLKSQIGWCFSGTGSQTLVEWDADPLALQVLTESLILAQNERWRRG